MNSLKRGLSKNLSSSKKAQFYFFAAIIIIGLASGIFIISNYAKKKTIPKISDLSEELKIEGEKVLDYGTKNNLNRGQKKDLLREFAERYMDYLGNNKNLYIIFTDPNEISAISYQNSYQEDVSIEGVPFKPDEPDGSFHNFPNANPEEEVEITTDGNNYVFKLKKGENFYFIISENIDGEKHVATG